MQIKPRDLQEEILKLFLLNMHLLTPGERSVIVKILNNLYGYVPIEEEFVNSKTVLTEK